jgi:hypothetical protein
MYPQPAPDITRAWTSAIRIQTEVHLDLEKSDSGDYAVLPRRKAGQSIPLGERAAVVLTRSVLERYFGTPLSSAAKELVRFSSTHIQVYYGNGV